MEQLNSDNVKCIQSQIQKCVNDDKIDELFFVGGSSEMPFTVSAVIELVGDDCKITCINKKRDLVARKVVYISFIKKQPNSLDHFNISIHLIWVLVHCKAE